jgi:hypothetical protein
MQTLMMAHVNSLHVPGASTHQLVTMILLLFMLLHVISLTQGTIVMVLANQILTEMESATLLN